MLIKLFAVFLWLALLLNLAGCATEPSIQNPVIRGFNPDPTIVRVGQDYYTATSSFHYFPGAPIYHSKNLVNWDLIGYALSQTSQLNLDNVFSARGIFAPTLRYHDGMFYLITTLTTGGPRAPERKAKGGNFLVTATKPAGPWSDPVWIEGAEGIDPDLFFDEDGRIYYSGNGQPDQPEDPKHRIIWTQELDQKTFQLIGQKHVFDPASYFKSGALGDVRFMEAPHIYKRNGYYYLMVAHGGTGIHHAVSIWRSKNVFGPWENNPNNPVVTHRTDPTAEVCCTGHADMAPGLGDQWWMVLLGIRAPDAHSLMGRETFLAQVKWQNDWPVVNEHATQGKLEKTLTGLRGIKNIEPTNLNFYDDFDSTVLNKHLNFIRTPRSPWWSLSRGALNIQLRPEQIENFNQPSFIGIRIPEENVDIQTEMDFSPKGDNEVAGLALERGFEAEWNLVKEMKNGQAQVTAYFDKTPLRSIPVELQKTLTLRITIDPVYIRFYVKQKGKWLAVAVDNHQRLPHFESKRFIGFYSGMYASSRGQASSNVAKFLWFSQAVRDDL